MRRSSSTRSFAAMSKASAGVMIPASASSRHERFMDAAYNLEPNIKESPGGLRDLQMVLWLARAAGLGTSWRELADQGLITPHEAAAIAINERVLQDLRIRLHYLAGRRE